MRNHLSKLWEKSLFFFSVVLLAIFSFVACSDDDDVVVVEPEQLIPELKLQDDLVKMSSAGGNASISYILTNAVEDDHLSVSCHEEWISDINTDQPGLITFKVAANDGLESREAVATVKYPKLANSVTFTIKQEGHAALRIDPELIEVGAEGGQQVVTYALENPIEGAELTATCNVAWIDGIEVSEKEIRFAVAANKTYEARESVITLTYPEIDDAPVITVKQTAALIPAITLGQKSIEMGREGGEGQVAYTIANPLEGEVVRAECLAEWVSDIQITSETVKFMVAKNPDPVRRETSLKLYYKDADTAEFIITQQEGELTDFAINVNGVNLEMVYVKGGTFMMGATEEQPDIAKESERPVHKVTVSDFYLGKFEVTQELYIAVMGENPSYADNVGDKMPVCNVSWDMAHAFINKLNELTGKTFCLPTEAQWEYAARGGQQSQGFVYAGSNNAEEVGWFYPSSNDVCHEVGQKLPNELGLYDMSGNVTETCEDAFGDYTADDAVDPIYPRPQDTNWFKIVHRGGSYYYGDNMMRVSARGFGDNDWGVNDMGLRLCISLASAEPEVPEVKTYSANGIDFNMVTVKGGRFQMGGDAAQGEAAQYDEFPVRNVTLSSFEISQTEVTQELYAAVMGNNPSEHTGNGKLPVDMITFNNAMEFAAKLSELTGVNFSLPTEAQWEFAARGGNLREGYMFSGSNDINAVGWFSGNCQMTQQVAKLQPNELGLYDMSGNVWEWCLDNYNIYPEEDQTNPINYQNMSGQDLKILRGGSWRTLREQECRTSFRHNYGLDIPGNAYGIRLVINK